MHMVQLCLVSCKQLRHVYILLQTASFFGNNFLVVASFSNLLPEINDCFIKVFYNYLYKIPVVRVGEVTLKM